MMQHRHSALKRWLIVIALSATGSFVLFQGCSKQTPTEAPSTTTIAGSGTITIYQSAGSRDNYSFTSGGRNYGKISMVTFDGVNAAFEANGIMTGSGTVAPEAGYGTSSSVQQGQGYFIKTDAAPHYGRLTVMSKSDNSAAHTITVGFDWVVQTEAGNRNL